MTIATRPGTSDDLDFVLHSWLKSYSESPYAKSMRRDTYFQDHHDDVLMLLPSTELRVACLEEDPATILGWACFEPGVIHYVLVKTDFRRHGIARMLLGELEPDTVFTQKSSMCRVLPIPQSWTYRPAWLYRHRLERRR